MRRRVSLVPDPSLGDNQLHERFSFDLGCREDDDLEGVRQRFGAMGTASRSSARGERFPGGEMAGPSTSADDDEADDEDEDGPGVFARPGSGGGGAMTPAQLRHAAFSMMEPIIERRSKEGDERRRSVSEALAYSEWKVMYPCVLTNFTDFLSTISGKRVVVFLDYDGTLTPIVSNPDEAFLSASMRAAVQQVAQTFPTAIISGRGRDKVEAFVQLQELYYAGSHGLDIKGPLVVTEKGATQSLPLEPAADFLSTMNDVYVAAVDAVQDIAGATIEHNKFSVSVHFRNCSPSDWPKVTRVVDALAQRFPTLHVTRGRKVLELRPKVDWDKGKALLHLVEALGLHEQADVLPVYIGDDTTDEDAFRVLQENGVGILVSSKTKPTAARYTLNDPEQVGRFLEKLVRWGQGQENAWHRHHSCVGWVAQRGAVLLQNSLSSHKAMDSRDMPENTPDNALACA